MICGLLCICMVTSLQAQYLPERSGFEGDFFSLQGAIELFRESNSLKAFERKINSKKYYVNNLDLDYDGRIDYVRVEHQCQGDFHVIILQVALDKYERQDIAVIEIEKIGRRNAVLQIIGDPDLYGQSVVAEPIGPTTYAETAGYSRTRYANDHYVNVYYWPVVQHMLAPRYRCYVSPYRWSYYPAWWVSWRPISWRIYYPRVRPYIQTCRVVNVYRSPRAHRFYQGRRTYSRRIAERSTKLRNRSNAPNARRGHRAYRDGDRYGNQRTNGNLGVERRGTYREGGVTSKQSSNHYKRPSTSRSKEIKKNVRRPTVSKQINRSSNHGRVSASASKYPSRKTKAPAVRRPKQRLQASHRIRQPDQNNSQVHPSRSRSTRSHTTTTKQKMTRHRGSISNGHRSIDRRATSRSKPSFSAKAKTPQRAAPQSRGRNISKGKSSVTRKPVRRSSSGVKRQSPRK